jgi:methylenetetrahydrofolate dehydrogenase (NADP+)/methenyltetrahydrofolate cyclohydrolase
MRPKALDGRALAASLLGLAHRTARRARRRLGRAPRLAVVAASGGDAESYLKAKRRACEKAGVELIVHRLSPGPRAKTVGLLAELAGDAGVDAVMVETPLPRGLHAADVAVAVPEAKDAEGVTPGRYGRLFLSKTWAEAHELVAPCTASALARLAQHAGAKPGWNALVIGRSATVGRPAAHMLSTMDLTVTVAHRRTRRLPELCRRADLLVVAAGKAGLVKPSWLKKGAVLLDAGIHARGKRIVGDADPACAGRAKWYTPVPGGVGPVTTAVAVLQAARLALARK